MNRTTRWLRILAATCAIASAAAAEPPDGPADPRPPDAPGLPEGPPHGPPPVPGPGEPPPGPGHGKGRRPPPLHDLLERYAERLGLDEKTRGAIREVTDAARVESEPLETELRQLHDGMRALLDADVPDAEQALAQADRIGAVETSLHKLRLRSMLRIRALLTPAQRQELVRIHEERRAERRRERAGPAPAPPDPPSPPTP